MLQSISTSKQIMVQRTPYVLENQPSLKNLTVLLLHFCYFIINPVPQLAIHLMCFDFLNTHTHTHTYTSTWEIYDGHGTVHKHNFPWFNLYGMSGDCIK